jgi:hypothetical protein
VPLYDADFFEVTRDRDGRPVSVAKVDPDVLGITVLVDESGHAPPRRAPYAFMQFNEGKPGRFWSKDEMIRVPRQPAGPHILMCYGDDKGLNACDFPDGRLVLGDDRYGWSSEVSR